MGASDPMEPDTSMTQQISRGARFPGCLAERGPGLLGGVTVIRTCLDSSSADRARETESDNFEAAGATKVSAEAAASMCIVEIQVLGNF